MPTKTAQAARMLVLSGCLSTLLLGQVLDAHGNLVATAGYGLDTPGTLISQINHPINGNRHSDLDSVGNILLATSAYDGASHIYLLDWFTGAQIGTVPVDASNSFGVGYDSLRGLYLVTQIQSSANLIKGFDGLSPTPVFTLTSPVTGLVGIAHDPSRDVYWVCSFQGDMVHAIHPTLGTVLQSFSTSAFGCTRPAGMAYDPAHDELAVGGRDQNRAFIMNAANGMLVTSFPVASGQNEPQGTGLFASGGSLWVSSWNSSTLYQYDNGHSLDLSLDFSIPGSVSVTIQQVQPGADCRFFFDVLPSPYTGSGSFAGASISIPQILLTLGWPPNVPPISTFGPLPTITYGPFSVPPGLHLNGAVLSIVGGQFHPPLRAAGGTVL